MKHLRLLSVPLLLAARLLAAEEPAPPAPATDDAPAWTVTLSEAIERARAGNRRILVELRDAQCPECERMEKLVYPAAAFRDLMRDKVAVSVYRNTEDGRRLAERFAVRTSPAWLVVTPDLVLCGKQEGASNQATWFERFVQTERAWGAFRKRIAEEKANPADGGLAFAVGEEAFRRFGDTMAEERFRRVAADGDAPEALRAKALAYLATTKDPALLEKAELRLADVEIGRGQKEKAAVRLRSFVEKHPASPLKAQAEALLTALGPRQP
jgi:hypothetical protein